MAKLICSMLPILLAKSVMAANAENREVRV